MPPFELKETSEEPALRSAEGVEFVPTYDGQEWQLQQCGVCRSHPVVTEEEQREIAAEVARLSDDMKNATERFLNGFESECE